MLHVTEIKVIALTEAYNAKVILHTQSTLKSTQSLDGLYCDFDNLKLSLPSFDF